MVRKILTKKLLLIGIALIGLLGVGLIGCPGFLQPPTVEEAEETLENQPPTDITWTTKKAPMPTARALLAFGVVGDKIYAIGGHDGSSPIATVEEYDPATDKWTTKAPMPAGRSGLAIGVVNNRIYAIGGSSSSSAYLTTVDEYDPATDKWTTKAPMPAGRRGFAVGVVNDKIYVIGGRRPREFDILSEFLTMVEEYTPATDKWTTKDSILPTGRSSLAVGVVNNKIYAIGGWNGSKNVSYLTTVEEYDSETNKWTTKASMSMGRSALAVGVVNDKIYAIGGGINSSPTAVVEEYDPATDRWVARAPMPTGRVALAVGVVDNKIYAIGGYFVSISDVVSAEVSDVVEESSFTLNDTSPPANVVNFTAIPRNGQISLSWMNPSDSDFSGVKILRKVNGYPTSPTDGMVIYDGAETSYTDTGLTNGTTYFYIVFSYDEVPNYSWGAQTDAAPTTSDIVWVTKAPIPTPHSRLAVGVVNNKIYATSGGVFLPTVEEYDPATNRWTTKASIPLVGSVGAVNNKIYAFSDTVEEYDPATDQRTTKAPMPTSRGGLAIGVVNNKIYVIGGQGTFGGYITTVEEYDPLTNRWRTKAPLPAGRKDFAIGVVKDKIYAIGGEGSLTSYLNTVEEYDPATNQWMTKAPMPTRRKGLAVGVVNNKIYAIGGEGGDRGELLNIVEEYDPATDQWTTKDPMPAGKGGLAVGVVNNKIYAVWGNTNVKEGILSGSFPAWNNPPTANAGPDQETATGVTVTFNGTGSDLEGDALSFVWDFNYRDGVLTQDATGQSVSHTYTTAGTYIVVLQLTDSKGAWNRDSLVVTIPDITQVTQDFTWVTKESTPMPTGRRFLAVGVVKDKIYAIGGSYRDREGSHFPATVEEYNPETNQWTAKAPMLTVRDSLAVGVVKDKIYAIGGCGGGFVCSLTVVEEYDPATNQWTIKASMPTGRFDLAIGVVNNKIYAVGGGDTKVEEYDPATDQWTTKAPMQTARYGLAVGVVNNKIYAIGGSDSPTVEEYDPVTDQWTTKAPMSAARTDLAVGVINNKIYAIGGRGDRGQQLSTVEEYGPATDQWTPKTPIPSARYGLAVGVVNNKIYAIWGFRTIVSGSDYPTTVEEGTLSP